MKGVWTSCEYCVHAHNNSIRKMRYHWCGCVKCCIARVSGLLTDDSILHVSVVKEGSGEPYCSQVPQQETVTKSSGVVGPAIQSSN